MQDYEGSEQEENDVEISYSVHGLPFPDRGPKQRSIPYLYHYVNGEASNYETSNKNLVSQGRARYGLAL